MLVERTRAAATLSEPLLELAARRLRTLGHPTRLRLIGLLVAGPRSVSDLARELELRRNLVEVVPCADPPCSGDVLATFTGENRARCRICPISGRPGA